MLKRLLIFIISFTILMSCTSVLAGDSPFMGEFSKELLNKAGVRPDDDPTVASTAERIGEVINIILSIAGVVIVIYIIYGGILWITAGGNEEKVKTAKKVLINAVIGAIIVGTAYTITTLILVLTQR